MDDWMLLFMVVVGVMVLVMVGQFGFMDGRWRV
jgi:hypothetical protein